jgi:hypothetical protein
MAYDRTTFQRLAKLRLDEAKILVREREYSGAYYIAGYAIECALKARIAAQFRENEIPDKNVVNKVYTHDPTDLVRLSGLESELNAALRADSNLDRRWSIVQNWNEQARYAIWTEQQAASMIDAVDGDDRTGGLFQWLSARW